MRRRVTLTVLLCSLGARAETARRSDVPNCGAAAAWVLVTNSEGMTDEFEAAVFDQLRAGLRSQALDLCFSARAATSPSKAELTLRRLETGAVQISVGTGARTLRRRLRLARLPEDGRPLAIAVAADELVRAAIAGAPAPDETDDEGEGAPPPTAPEAPSAPPAERARPPAKERRFAAGVRLSSEHYAGGERTLGMDVGLRHALVPRLYTRVALGYRAQESVRTPNGEIAGSAWGGEAGLGLVLLRVAALTVAGEAGIRAAQLRARGKPVTGARGSEQSAWFFTGRAGVALEMKPTAWLGLELRGGAGYALRALELRDHGRTETAISGLELYASFGPNFVF